MLVKKEYEKRHMVEPCLMQEAEGGRGDWSLVGTVLLLIFRCCSTIPETIDLNAGKIYLGPQSQLLDTKSCCIRPEAV